MKALVTPSCFPLFSNFESVLILFQVLEEKIVQEYKKFRKVRQAAHAEAVK